MELPKATELLKQSWQMFKSKVKIFILIQLVPFAAAIPIVIIIGALEFMEKGQTPDDFGPKEIVLFIALIVVGVLSFLLQIWSQIALLMAIDDPNPHQNFKEVFRKARPLLMSYFLVSFLTFIIVLGGFLLLIVPGIIFGLWYSMATYTLILEGKRGMDALRTSKSYVKGNIMMVLGRFVLLGFIAILLYAIPSGILEALNLGPVADIYSAALSLVFTPIASVYAYLIYRGLRDAHLPSPIAVPAPEMPVTPPATPVV